MHDKSVFKHNNIFGKDLNLQQIRQCYLNTIRANDSCIEKLKHQQTHLHLNANIHILAGVNPEGPPLLHQSQTDHQYD